MKSIKREKAIMTNIQDGTPYLKIWYKYYSKFFLDEDIYFVCCNTPDGILDKYSCNKIHRNVSVHNINEKIPILNQVKGDLLEQYECVTYADLDEIIHHPKGLSNFIREVPGTYAKCTSYQIVHKKDKELPLNLDKPIKEQRSYWSRTPWFDKPLILKKNHTWGPGQHNIREFHSVSPGNKDLILIHLRIADFGIAHNLNIKNFLSDNKPIGGGEYNFFIGDSFNTWWEHGIQNRNKAVLIPKKIRQSFKF